MLKNNFKIQLLTIFCGGLLGIFSALFYGTIIMSCVIAVVGFLLWKIAPAEDKKFIMGLFLTGLAVRVIILSIIYITSLLNNGNGEIFPDSRLYFLKTLYMMRRWKGMGGNLLLQIRIQDRWANSGYNYILAFFYLLTGYNPSIDNPISLFSDKLINCLISTIIGVVIFYLAKDIFGRQVAKLSSILVTFYPTLILWSTTNLRDPSQILLTAIVLLVVVKLCKEERKRIRYLFILFLSLFFLKTIRNYMLFLTIFALAIHFFIARVSARRKIALLIFGFIIIIFTKHVNMLKNELLNPITLVTKLANANDAVVSQKGSNYRIYESNLITNGVVNKIKFLKIFLKGVVYFMLVPFPWAIYSQFQFFSYPQIILWYFLLPFAFLGILLGIKHKLSLSSILLAYILVVTSFFALIEGNIGSALRHRDAIVPFYLIFSAVGIVRLLGWRLSDERK